MQAAEVKQRIALQLKSFVQPTMAVTKRSQDAKKVIKASQSELVRAAKFLKANFADSAELVAGIRAEFDKLVELEDNADILQNVATRASDLLPAVEEGRPLVFNLKAAVQKKYADMVADRLHSVHKRHESAKKWQLEADDDVVVDDGGDEDKKFLAWRCPITMKEVDQPMRNAKCGHSYNRAAILDAIRRTPSNSMRCPVRGCKEIVKDSTLEPNEDLELGFERALKHKNNAKLAGKKKPKQARDSVEKDDDDDDDEAPSAKKARRS